MKAVVAYLLVGLILGNSLIPGFGLDQSARMVELMQHYGHHRVEQPGLGFLDFLAMHYGPGSEHQKHPNHCHHNLPVAGHSIVAFAPTFPRLIDVPLSPLIRLPQQTCFGYANLYSFLGVFSLINPPRR